MYVVCILYTYLYIYIYTNVDLIFLAWIHIVIFTNYKVGPSQL